MAVGDIISDVGVINTAFSMHSAAGVEIVLTMVGLYNNWCWLTDGVNQSQIIGGMGAGTDQNMNCKIEEYLGNRTIRVYFDN